MPMVQTPTDDTDDGAAMNGGRRPTVVAALVSTSPELSARPRRRTFTAKDKLVILADIDRVTGTGSTGAIPATAGRDNWTFDTVGGPNDGFRRTAVDLQRTYAAPSRTSWIWQELIGNYGLNGAGNLPFALQSPTDCARCYLGTGVRRVRSSQKARQIDNSARVARLSISGRSCKATYRRLNGWIRSSAPLASDPRRPDRCP